MNLSDRPPRKTRVIASNQQVLRIDREIKREISEQTLEKIIGNIKKQITEIDLIILSDYDKGLITRELVERTVALAKQHQVLV